MNLIKMILLVIVIAATVSGCNSSGGGEPAVAIEGTIVFMGPYKGQSAGIYLLDAQGTRLLVGNGHVTLADPVWSPDGTQIAYITDKLQVAVIKRDGSGGAILTPESDDPSSWPYRPAWTPDGNISFEVPGKLVILHPDGSGLRVLRRSSFCGNQGLPAYAWSPDGKQIVYYCAMFVNLFDVESGESRRLRTLPGPFVSLAWSPDGETILGAVGYTSVLEPLDVDEDLYVFSSNRSGMQALAQPGLQKHPSWSPDGKQIVYESFTKNSEGSSFGLWVMNADGSGVQPLIGAVGFRGLEPDAETSGLPGHQPDWTSH